MAKLHSTEFDNDDDLSKPAVKASALGGQSAIVAEVGTDQGGYGTWAVDGTADAGIGVHGTSTGVDRDGNAGIGVVGESDMGTGVAGESTEGVGVYGRSTSGLAMQSDGDASQALWAGGWVKALVFLSSGNVVRSFNSQPDVAAPTCVRLNTGVYSIDFHFRVNNRYVVVTPIAGNYSSDGFSNELNPFAPLWWPPDPPSPFASKFFIANIVFDGLSAPPSFNTSPPGQGQPNPTMVTVMTFQPQFIKSGAGLLFQGFQLQDTSVCVAVF